MKRGFNLAIKFDANSDVFCSLCLLQSRFRVCTGRGYRVVITGCVKFTIIASILIANQHHGGFYVQQWNRKTQVDFFFLQVFVLDMGLYPC